MKKIFGLLSATIILFSSCSKEEEPAAPLSDGVLLKSKIETFSDASVLTTNYTYNENSLLRIDNSDGESETYTYDIDGRITSHSDVSRNGAGDLITTTSTYTYDDQNRLVSIVFMDARHIDYVYNSSGTITENHYSILGTEAINLVGSYTYTLQNGNVLYEQGVGVSAGNNTTLYYDNKNNPFRNVHQGRTVLIFKDFMTNNNVTTFTNNVSANSYSSNYIYNSFNYPVASITTYGDGEIVNTQFIYE